MKGKGRGRRTKGWRKRRKERSGVALPLELGVRRFTSTIESNIADSVGEWAFSVSGANY